MHAHTMQPTSAAARAVVLLSCCFAVLAISDLETLRQEIMRIFAVEGIDNPALPGLLKSYLDEDPKDHSALGLLTLKKIKMQEFKEAIKLSRRLEKARDVPESVQLLAKELTSTLKAVNSTKIERPVAIAKLRDLASFAFLAPKGKKTFFHNGTEQCMRELAKTIDDGLMDLEAFEDYWASQLLHYIPGLHKQNFWPAEQLTIAKRIEEAAKIITKEISALYDDPIQWKEVENHTHKDEAIVMKGSWVELSIFSSGRFNKTTCIKLPKTCNVLRQQIDLTTNPAGIAFVSELRPNTHLFEHRGITNAQLTLHLGLRVPPTTSNNSAGINVAGEIRHWVEGQVLAFDDSNNHMVWNQGIDDGMPRTVLVVSMWHPEISIRERQAALHFIGSGDSKYHWDDTEDLEEALDVLESQKATDSWNAQSSRIRKSLENAKQQQQQQTPQEL